MGQNFSPLPRAPQAQPKKQEPKVLTLPKSSRCATHMVSYLHGRGIDYDVIDYCIQTGRLYESLPYHNCVFVGRDLKGQPRYAALRGTVGDFKGEAPGISLLKMLPPQQHEVHASNTWVLGRCPS